MGFLSNWDEAKRIDVSDLAGADEGTWWVDIKPCLTHEEADRILRKMMRSTVKITGGQGTTGVRTQLSTDDLVNQQANIILESVIGWNLTDRDGNVLPIGDQLEASLKLLPSPVYDRIAKEVTAANSEKSGEVADFPSGGGEFIQDGEDESSDDSEVLV